MAKIAESFLFAFGAIGKKHPDWVHIGKCYRGLFAMEPALVAELLGAAGMFVYFREIMATSRTEAVAMKFAKGLGSHKRVLAGSRNVLFEMTIPESTDIAVKPLLVKQLSDFPN